MNTSAPATTPANHTPGPWKLTTFEDGSMAIIPTKGFTITALKPRKGFDEDIPNAQLMAAAPELLQVAEHILRLLEGPKPNKPGAVSRDMLRAAIAKAKGGA